MMNTVREALTEPPTAAFVLAGTIGVLTAALIIILLMAT
jgi:hypothetical protein